ncbi:MAG: hypothetical protein BWY28_01793 [bacterium ADurb.Bin236]|nr:MAG: hypothetical protein BWY28_01793 [bacterium ADurb.Bin236]
MKTRRTGRCAAVVLSALVAIALGTFALADIEPPAMTAGWSLVSAPCDVSVQDILDNTGFDSLNIFEWNGERYAASDTLKRGIGYAADSNRSIGAAGLCADSNDEDPLAVRLPAGWNLIGNPYKRAMRVHFIMNGFDHIFADQVFKLTGAGYESISKMDVVQPWNAVWVYAYSPVVIPHNADCETSNICDIPPELVSIQLSAVKNSLNVGETTALTVSAIYSNSESREVTAEAQFQASSGSVSDGVFTAESEGTAILTATFGGMTSDPVSISVIDPLKPVELIVSLKPALIQIHQTATLLAQARLASGALVNATASASWSFDPAAGRLEPSGVFSPARIGDVVFTASYGGLVSSPVTLSVYEKQLIWLGIYPESSSNLKPLPCPPNYGYMYCYDNNYIEAGKQGAYRAVAEYNNGTYRYDSVKDIEKWDVEDESVLLIGDNGSVAALKKGRTGVRAYLDGVWSEWSQVQVVDDSTEDFLLLELSNQASIARVGEGITVNATYYTRIPGQGVHPPYYVYMNYVTDGVFEARKVTASADWTIGSRSVGSFDRDTALFTGRSIGSTAIFAKYNGSVSNFATLEIWDSAPLNHCAETANAATWTDNLTIARLATDCDHYSAADTINVNFAALLREGQYRGTLDVCADMFIYNSEQELVKTFRNTDCTPSALFSSGSPTYKTVFEYNAEWDQRDETGAPVPPGEYTAVARFYILYCPVIKVEFTINAD